MKALLWRLVAWPLAFTVYLYSKGIVLTLRLRRPPPVPAPAIYVNWHRHLPLTMVLHGAARRWTMMSPSPHMAPIAAWARLLGQRLVRGTGGAGGRLALDALEQKLRAGQDVVLAVDGPRGPLFRAKPGCAELAVRTGAPIVAWGYRSPWSFTTPGRWDHQLMLLPFGRVELVERVLRPEPEESVESLLGRVQRALDELDER